MECLTSRAIAAGYAATTVCERVDAAGIELNCDILDACEFLENLAYDAIRYPDTATLAHALLPFVANPKAEAQLLNLTAELLGESAQGVSWDGGPLGTLNSPGLMTPVLSSYGTLLGAGADVISYQAAAF